MKELSSGRIPTEIPASRREALISSTSPKGLGMLEIPRMDIRFVTPPLPASHSRL